MRYLPNWGSALLVVAALLVPSQTLQAQREGRWIITPRLGQVFWDDAAALQDPALNSDKCDFPEFNQTCAAFTNNLQAGISLLYGVAERFSVGLSFDVVRPVTNGAYFPPVEMEIGGQQELTVINQRLTIVQYAVEGEWGPPLGRIFPYVVGSIGGYTVYMDPAKVDFAGVTGFQKFGDLMYTLGVGIDFAIGSTAGLRVEFRDMIYTGWDRDRFYPVLPRYQSSLFPDLMPAPPEESGTLHNLRFALAFSFVPGGSR
jgi:hypothetical protein